MENTKPSEATSIPSELLSSLHHTIDQTTQEFIETFEKAAKDVKVTIDREFSQKPWMYFTSFIGVGVVIGYFIGRAEKNI